MSEKDGPWSHGPAGSIRPLARGLLWRIALTIFVPIAWVGATLLLLAFWPTHFSLVQNVVVFVVSMLVLFGAIVAMWISFGVRTVRRWVDW